MVAPPPIPFRRHVHVLYVDDEAPLVQLAVRFLRRMGYAATGCTDPVTALNVFRREPTHFDAVITDLTMPGMSGLELASRLSAVRADLPILLTSGHVKPEVESAALRLGIRCIIHKREGVERLGHALDGVFGHTFAPS